MAASGDGGGADPRLPKIIVVFHDSENVTLDKVTNAAQMREAVLRASLSAVTDDSTAAEANLNLIQVMWQVPICLEKVEGRGWWPRPQVKKQLMHLGLTFVDPGLKPDAVDTALKNDMANQLSLYGGLPIPKSYVLFILMSGDADFSGSVQRLLQGGFGVVLIHKGNLPIGVTALVPPRCNIPSWPELSQGVWRRVEFSMPAPRAELQFKLKQLKADPETSAKSMGICLKDVRVDMPDIILTICATQASKQGKVYVIYTTDGWDTHHKVAAFCPDPSQSMRIYVANIELENDGADINRIDFAITLTPKAGVDSTDSNGGSYYTLERAVQKDIVRNDVPADQRPQPPGRSNLKQTIDVNVKVPVVRHLRLHLDLLDKLRRQMSDVCADVEINLGNDGNLSVSALGEQLGNLRQHIVQFVRSMLLSRSESLPGVDVDEAKHLGQLATFAACGGSYHFYKGDAKKQTTSIKLCCNRSATDKEKIIKKMLADNGFHAFQVTVDEKDALIVHAKHYVNFKDSMSKRDAIQNVANLIRLGSINLGDALGAATVEQGLHPTTDPGVVLTYMVDNKAAAAAADDALEVLRGATCVERTVNVAADKLPMVRAAMTLLTERLQASCDAPLSLSLKSSAPGGNGDGMLTILGGKKEVEEACKEAESYFSSIVVSKYTIQLSGNAAAIRSKIKWFQRRLLQEAVRLYSRALRSGEDGCGGGDENGSGHAAVAPAAINGRVAAGASVAKAKRDAWRTRFNYNFETNVVFAHDQQHGDVGGDHNRGRSRGRGSDGNYAGAGGDADGNGADSRGGHGYGRGRGGRGRGRGRGGAGNDSGAGGAAGVGGVGGVGGAGNRGRHQAAGGGNVDYCIIHLRYTTWTASETEAGTALCRRVQSMDSRYTTDMLAAPGVRGDFVHKLRISANLDEPFVDVTLDKKMGRLYMRGEHDAVQAARAAAEALVQGHITKTLMIPASTPMAAFALLLYAWEKDLLMVCEQLKAAQGPAGRVYVSPYEGSSVLGVLELRGPESAVQTLSELAKKKVVELETHLDRAEVRNVTAAELDILEKTGGQNLRARIEKKGVAVLLPGAIAASLRKGSKQQHEGKAGSAATSGSSCTPPPPDLVAGLSTGLRVLVRTCNFQQTGCVALVNAANSQLHHAGGLAKAIADAAGLDFHNACRDTIASQGSVAEGSARATRSGLLQSLGIRCVIHAVAPMYSEREDRQRRPLLRRCFYSALQEAERQGMASLAIPAVGSSIFGWWDSVVAQEAVEALVQWAKDYPHHHHLKEVVFFDINAAKTRQFYKALRDRVVKDATTVADSAGDGPVGKNLSDLARAEAVAPLQRPIMPTEPTHRWWWAMPEQNKWFEYDYDQVAQLEEARQAGIDKVTLKGDRGGQYSDSAHRPAGSSGAVYEVTLSEMVQRNIVSKYPRNIRREQRRPGDPTPPLFTERMREKQRELDDYNRRREALRTATVTAIASSGAGAGQDAGSASNDTTVRVVLLGEDVAVVANGSRSTAAPVAVAVDPSLIVLFGRREHVNKAAAELKAGIKKFYETEQLKRDGGDAANSQRLLQQPNVRDALAKHGSTATVNAAGKIELRYLHPSAPRVVQQAMLEALVDMSQDSRIKPPKHWRMSDGQPYTRQNEEEIIGNVLVEVPKDSAEYAKVKDTFSIGAFDGVVERVERVQNYQLWERYQNNQRREGFKNDPVKINERTMFHGSTSTDPKILVETGFDFRHASSGYFGRGAYFAESMTYSHGYRYRLGEGRHQAFIAKVTCGKIDERGMSRDSKIVKPNPGFDSIGGLVTATDHAIIVYDLGQAYPEYLVTYAK